MFPRGVDRVCYNVPILQDNECEVSRLEIFFCDLQYVSGVMPITIDPGRVQVLILDTTEPECGE